MIRLPEPGDRHPDAGRDALSEGPGGGLDAGSPVILGMARATAVELAKMLDVIERDGWSPYYLVLRVDREHARQMQHRVEQHRRMPGREHKPVPVGPNRIPWIEPQEALPQAVDHRR